MKLVKIHISAFFTLLIIATSTVNSSQCPGNSYCHCSEVTIDCSRLRLQEILPGMASKNNVHLVDIDFRQNDIQEIYENSFSTYKRVRTINLSKNRIENIHENSLSHLKGVVQIYLDDNRLSSLSETTFSELSQLEVIELSGNRLRSLPEAIFQSLSSLKQLRMNDNFLKTLPVNIFSGNPLLSTLYLEYNNLATAHYQWFQHFLFKKDGELYLDNNPWVCDCRMKDMYVWEKKNTLFKSAPNDGDGPNGRITVPRCQYPTHHRGKTIDLLNSEQFNCVKPSIVGNKTHRIIATSGDNVHLKCDVESNPPAEVIFILPNGTEVRSGHLKKSDVYQFHRPTEIVDGHFLTQTHLEGELNISDIGMAQRGVYKCRATGLDMEMNEYSVVISYEVKVKGDVWHWVKLLAGGVFAGFICVVLLRVWNGRAGEDEYRREEHRRKYLIDPPAGNVQYDPSYRLA